MKKRILFAFVYMILRLACAFAGEDEDAMPVQSPFVMETQLAMTNNIEPIKGSDRILIFAPHPDDESIACAGIIQKAVTAGADVHVAYFTNGDNNEFAFIVYDKRIPLVPAELVRLGEVRRSEAIKAMKLLGLKEDDLIFLGYPDFGTFQIFKNFWQEGKPYRSMLTRATSVPYKNEPSYGSPYIGQSILSDLENILLRYRPNKVFVSHPADVNSDHKTLYLFLEVALADLKDDFKRPDIYCYLVHWKAWPLPRHYHPDVPLLPPDEFKAAGSDIRWLKSRLTQQQLANKYQAILAYKSQTQVSAFYLLAFCRKDELFSVYPEIDITGAVKPAEEKKVSIRDRIEEKMAALFGWGAKLPETGFENTAPAPGKPCLVIYEKRDDCFLIRISKDRNIDRRLKTVLYLFGYSRKTPFAQMPKIMMVTRYTYFKMFDGKKEVAPQGVNLEISPEELTVRIPFTVLGDPDFIVVSVRGNAGVTCPDTLSFRKVNIRKNT